MEFHVTVVAEDERVESELSQQLAQAIAQQAKVRITLSSKVDAPEEWGNILFIDSKIQNLHPFLQELDRSQRALFLIVSDQEVISPEILALLEEEHVDDVLVRPFRSLEVFGKIRHYQQILLWEEVKKLSYSFTEVLGRLQDDVKLAERIQKNKAPLRFPDVKGFQVSSRYLAGMKSGGDYFDLAESKTANQMSIILSDSSSYGLTSAMLSVLMRVTMKLTADQLRSCHETLEKIREEIVLTLSEKDRLSIFYGIVSRKDYKLRYLNFGSSRAYYAPHEGHFSVLGSHGDAITQTSGTLGLEEKEVSLSPQSRLVVVSDGFIDSAGGGESFLKVLDEFRGKSANDLLNELAFQVKSRFQEPEDMPAQDCTALVFDADAKLLRAV